MLCVCACVRASCMSMCFCIGSVSGLVIYTGSDTRSVMNASSPRSKVYNRTVLQSTNILISCKVGLVDLEINRLTKLLFLGLFIFSLIMLALKVCTLLCC